VSINYERLHDLSQEELVILVTEMLESQPSLGYLVDRPRPGFHPIGVPIDVSSFRQELDQATVSAVRYAFAYDDERYRSGTLSDTATSMARKAAQFASYGDWSNAVRLYEVILRACLAVEYRVRRFDYVWRAAIVMIYDGLVDALGHPELQEDEEQYKSALFGILNLVIWHHDQVDDPVAEFGIEAVFMKFVRPQDVVLVRRAILYAIGLSSEATRDSLERLLIELDTRDDADPDLALKRLRERGLYLLVLEKLLSLDRLDDALAVFEEHLFEVSPETSTVSLDLFKALDAIVQHGHYDVACKMAESAWWASSDHRLIFWLGAQSKQQDDPAVALKALELHMAWRPSDATYRQLAKSAQQLDRWEELHPHVIERVIASGDSHLLLLIYLYDKSWDIAWETLDSMGQEGMDRELDLLVALKSGRYRPQRAIPICVRYAREHIGRRTRKHYAEAAKILKSVRPMYRYAKDVHGWTELMKGIRQEFHRRTALMEELSRLKL